MKKRTTAAILAVALLAAAPSTASAATQPAVSEDEFAQQLLAYAENNPADVEGFKRLAESLGGDSASTSSTLTSDEVPGLKDTSGGAVSPMAGNFPSDVFTVNIVKGTVGNTIIVTGSVDWRDNFAGQSAPFDIASLRFSSGCGTLSNLTSSTRDLRGNTTSRSSLREAGVGTNAPIWNVDSVTSGFENQADRGSFQARYDITNCGGTTVQAAFDYEGNQGGSLVSVSAGWGGLSVGYNAAGLVLKKSTQALSLN